MTRVIAMVLAISMASCGLTQTRGPDPMQPPDQRPTCTETMAAPKRDAIGAVIGAVAILFGVVAIKAGDNETVGAPLIIAAVSGFGALRTPTSASLASICPPGNA